MSAATKWDAREYQRIASASRRGDDLVVQFEDGSQVNVDAQRVLPPDTRAPQWDAMNITPYEIVIPTLDGEFEVPWSTIRVLTPGRDRAAVITRRGGAVQTDRGGRMCLRTVTNHRRQPAGALRAARCRAWPSAWTFRSTPRSSLP